MLLTSSKKYADKLWYLFLQKWSTCEIKYSWEEKWNKNKNSFISKTDCFQYDFFSLINQYHSQYWHHLQNEEEKMHFLHVEKNKRELCVLCIFHKRFILSLHWLQSAALYTSYKNAIIKLILSLKNQSIHRRYLQENITYNNGYFNWSGPLRCIHCSNGIALGTE